MTPPRLKIRRTPDLLAAVPYLLGFHPADSVVVVALRLRSLQFALRFDLDGADPAAVAQLIAQHAPERVLIIGYGTAPRVTAVLPALAAALRLAGVTVLDEVRVTDGRYWSLSGADAEPCHLDSSVVAAAATFQGLPALPDRAALVAQLAPVTGEERAAVTAATAEVEERLARWTPEETVVRAGLAVVRAARSGVPLAAADVALLGVLLQLEPFCDFVWDFTEATVADQTLWMDVVRRVEPSFVPAPAALLAFVAWRMGLGPLAGIAVERALAVEPDYG
ncbi:DUF4192 domain-containing protein, partial [Actinoplanes sp. NPDC051633]|uniref:DUF4192 domain-containing protein n=1 Tax=Actinoplanes sp. NPDC051633 TaxID=3155670 RepID=UPI0034319BDC